MVPLLMVFTLITYGGCLPGFFTVVSLFVFVINKYFVRRYSYKYPVFHKTFILFFNLLYGLVDFYLFNKL